MRAYVDQTVIARQAARWGIPSNDEVWAAERVESMPRSWSDVLLKRWRERRNVNPTQANLDHLHRCKAIGRAHRAGLRADANDGQICEEAKRSAAHAQRRGDHIAKMVERKAADAADPARLTMLAKFVDALHWLTEWGAADAFLRHARRDIAAALKRLTCERFWRAVLRQMHARAVESTARAIGLVHKRAGLYVSDDTLKRRRGQLVRNAVSLESVIAVNEHSQEHTLAELAAKGPANREIRRHELMTRIAGFEHIARECGHVALFVTVTCPSRMHAWRTKPGGFGTEANPSFDGTLPDAAQKYLAKQWNAFTSACARWGVDLYGFRIAEPNHDGTPHWHALLFMPGIVGRGTVRTNPRSGKPVATRVVLRLLRRHFFRNADPHERGARKHRVKVERIDWSRGSAAGYVAKYVAKNIDGYRVDKDLYGNDALTSSQRVDAWASTWRIRQFQQFGGAPVGVWRELRRLHPEQGRASVGIDLALQAVNIASEAGDANSELMQRHTAAHGWATYVELQGGVRVRRADLRIKLLREQSGELGRYGELMPPRPVGVQTADVRSKSVQFGIMREPITVRRTVATEVESERCDWVIVPRGFTQQALDRMRVTPARGAAVRPWSPVNNSTRPTDPVAAHFGPKVERSPKLGRWHRWKRRERPHEPSSDR